MVKYEVQARVVPARITYGASLKIAYYVELETWKANLRLVPRDPFDGERWRAYLSWGPRGNREHTVCDVESKIRYWKGPVGVPGRRTLTS